MLYFFPFSKRFFRQVINPLYDRFFFFLSFFFLSKLHLFRIYFQGFSSSKLFFVRWANEGVDTVSRGGGKEKRVVYLYRWTKKYAHAFILVKLLLPFVISWCFFLEKFKSRKLCVERTLCGYDVRNMCCISFTRIFPLYPLFSYIHVGYTSI